MHAQIEILRRLNRSLQRAFIPIARQRMGNRQLKQEIF